MTYDDLSALSLLRLARMLALRSEPTKGAPEYRKVRVLPLFEARTKDPKNPVPPGAWTVLMLGEAREGWGAAVILPGQLSTLDEAGLEHQAPWDDDMAMMPVDPLEPPKLLPGSPQMVELVELLQLFQVPCTWSYRKDGATTAETRRGVPVGVRQHLLFAADADRGGALRSFKLEQAWALLPAEVKAAPRWSPGVGYVVPRQALGVRS